MIDWLLAAALAVAPAMEPAAAPARSEPAPPTNPSFRHYGVLDGLPSDAAYTVVRDKSGYIWIGTRDGLARFDGSEFRIFRHDGGDPDSIAANNVSAVLVDRQGRVWAGGEGSGMDGCTLAGMLRARGLDVPMLAVTASSRGDAEQRIRAAGMNALLRKPVLPEALRETMEATRAK